jgi:hypothetical protein
VIGAVDVAGPGAPKRRNKNDRGQKEEHAGDFKHEFSTHAAEGAQKTADAADNSPRNLSSYLPGGLTGCAALGAVVCGLPVLGRTWGALSGRGCALAGYTPGDA